MDLEYELDRDRYRSLRASRNTAVWTGVIPPLLLGPVSIASIVFEPDGEGDEAKPDWYDPATIAVGATAVGIPPVFGHAYAGEFHVGLAITGLVADALMASGLYLHLTRDDEFTARDLTVMEPSHGLYDTFNGVWKTVQVDAPLYLVTAAVAVRLTAGMYDARRSWIVARNTNLFRSVRPVREIDDSRQAHGQPEDLSRERLSGILSGITLRPHFDPIRGPGVSIRARW